MLESCFPAVLQNLRACNTRIFKLKLGFSNNLKSLRTGTVGEINITNLNIMSVITLNRDKLEIYR